MNSNTQDILQFDEKLHSHTGQGGTHLIPALERWRQENQEFKVSDDSYLRMGWTKTDFSRGDS